MRQGVTRSILAALALGATLIGCSPSDRVTATTTAPTGDVVPLAIGPAVGYSASSNPGPDDALSIGSAAIDTTGGSIPDGQMVSPLDVGNPVVGLLDPLLLRAIQDAARAAADDGVDLRLTSGWRSRGFQQRLFDEAVTTYGSADVASQFVASPDDSMHVRGRAVDVGPVAADEWMIRNGARFGLCQIYANEIWHFERVVDAASNCPPLKPNAAG